MAAKITLSGASRLVPFFAGTALLALGACGNTTKNRGGDAASGAGNGATGPSSGGAGTGAAGGSSSLGGDAAMASAGEVATVGEEGPSPCPTSPAACLPASDPCGRPLPIAPLFVAADNPARDPIVTTAANGHLLYRGAARLRMRHEMESEYGTFPGHYFEDRAFAYSIDDGVAAGDGKIVFTYLPDANQYFSAQGVNQEGGADPNLRFWKIYGHLDGNAFAGNIGGAAKDFLPSDCADPLTSCNTRKYQYTIDFNQRDNRALKVGDQLQIELGVFLARYSLDGSKGPPSDTGHVRNNAPLPNGCTENGPPYNNACYTQANYYSDSIRYVVGKGTLTPYNEDCAMSVPPGSDVSGNVGCAAGGVVAQAVAAGTLADRTGPSEAGWAGGLATLPYLRQRFDLYYSQMSPNILGENADDFVRGRHLFHVQFDSGEDAEVNNVVSAAETKPYLGIAGPLYNQVSCEGCHVKNSRGFAPAGGSFESLVVRLDNKTHSVSGAILGDDNYGLQLQEHSGAGALGEGHATLTYDTVTSKFDDGTPFTLRKPKLSFQGLSSDTPQSYSLREARPIIGIGLLEAISEDDILALSDPEDCNKDGISGVANLVTDPQDGKLRIGRFGWKAAQISARHQVARDLVLDMGVTSSVFPKLDCGARQADCSAGDTAAPEMSDRDLDRLVSYVRTLAVPPRRDINDAQVMHGQELFAQAGCSVCHAPNQHTGKDHPFLELRDQVIHPFSDLLLHDMGTDLMDASQGESLATASEWRTPPLWGIGLCDDVAAGYQEGAPYNPSPNLGPCTYLHDGRAESLVDAVLWHGGEAQEARKNVLAMSSSDRDALIVFLKSL